MREATRFASVDGSSASAPPGPAPSERDQLGSFLLMGFAAIFLFLVLYINTVRGVEALLELHFRRVVAEAIQITDTTKPVTSQIQERIDARVRRSRWVRWGGVQQSVIVLGRDGRTWLYVVGNVVPPPPNLDPAAIVREAERVLPASAEIVITLPHNSLLANAILLSYAGLLLQGLFVYNRASTLRDARRLSDAIASRDQTLSRTASIERELETVQERLQGVEPVEREHQVEIASMQSERESLQRKLAALAAREEELRGKAARAVELDQERRALEDLLEEAAGDLSTKDDEIRGLEQRLKRADRGTGTGKSSKAKEASTVERRLRTLYKTLEIDDRAVDDFVALRDETMKLKAEECLKRLSEEADNVAVRRKVGGLPNQVNVFELGFAGKGRIYYARGRQRRFRIMAVGAKNTQKTDLEYLSRQDTST